MYYSVMNKITTTPESFQPVEEKINRVCGRMPGSNKQNVLLVHLVKHVYAGLHSRMNEALREYELNSVSFQALMMLFGDPERSLNPSELAEATGESRANVTRICDELVAKGLLERTPNQDDRRRVDLRLAKAGEDEVYQLLPLLRQRCHVVFDVLDQDEKNVLESLLKRVLCEFD
ncbi:MarR family transcriptional regulator [Andreprevotia chitinilytica]|uniref:MarR family transcriptional regulator n=1 Tax=Andreprevotia chitinilytica TaxID=396808 RepID=UPI0014700E32|nr:MarR family transcriptional regulator [Andreprevotia chitinilytica]